MPQMAPMNWTLLFIIFVALYLISMILVFFLPKQLKSNTKNFETNFILNKSAWKW